MDRQRLCDLCSTFLYSESVEHQRKRTQTYISRRLGHPDDGSNFGRVLGKSKYLFRIPGINRVITPVGLWYLQRNGYDMLMLDLVEQIIGYTAFQIHKDDSLHMFSAEVLPEYQGKGLARHMVEKILNEARKKEIQRMRIGRGNHEAANRIYNNFAERSDELRIVAHESNWIDILH